jgi:hypothetical protein
MDAEMWTLCVLDRRGPFLMFIDDRAAGKVGSTDSMRYRYSGSAQVRNALELRSDAAENFSVQKATPERRDRLIADSEKVKVSKMSL